MNIIIHRGTNQIGGCVTEINTLNSRIFIDLGSELPDQDGNSVKESLDINGVTNGDINCDAIFFTHYHGDHIGMLGSILPRVPLYMGEAAKEIYYILQKRLRNGIPEEVKRINTFKALEVLRAGDFRITPFLVDHSAYDAYMFLIEAEGKRILHTGDFRGHGFRGKSLIPMLEKHVGQVDVLITEGTMLSRDNTETMSERELQKIAKEYMTKYKYIFLICSSTNIDRLGSFHEATPLGKYFVTDQYQHDIIKVVRKFAGSSSILYQFKKALVYGKNLNEKLENRGFCMPVRSGNAFNKIMQYYKTNHNDETLIIYSMWKGYLQQSNNSFGAMLDGFNHIEFLHTSGHATKQSIIDVCNVVNPKQAIIPIHIEKSALMNQLLSSYNIENLIDGQVYQV